ncbi:MAG: ROK family transcriptional regulator [Acidimicrobiia bacterium]|nr:ROK family transcriptional regulator [Acidimicrobiia bacterium]MDH4307084.1 ROK family transcriptional regulator [Acidimicrobiia bacterium]MDH5293280.1 ROK family transcriptional regulator [Acidimicrobiia bacterium]
MTRQSPTARHPKKTSRDDSRRWNLLATLQTVAASGATSRADIARATGLTKASVSSIVAELLDEGLIHEIGTAPSDGGGKPPTLLAIHPRGRDIVAVDLSRRPIRAALVGLGGPIHHRVSAPEPGVTGPAALDAALELVARCLDRAEAPVLGIGVGTPGMLDPDGTVIEATNLDWHGVAVGAELARRFGLPVSVGNDAHVSALAEMRSHPRDSLLLVKIGQGIGSGLVLNGVLHTGDRFVAGEIGHVVVDRDGAICRCGNRGCLETVASVPAIVERAAGVKDPDLPWDAMALAARFGEATVREAIDVAGRAIGEMLATAAALLDVTHIVIASDLANSSEAIVDAVERSLTAGIHPSSVGHIEVTAASARSDLVLAGAVAMVLRDELGVVLR